MEDFTVEIAVRTTHPITEELLFAVAEIGGVATGHVGQHALETTLTVRARSLMDAGKEGMRKVLAIAPGATARAEVMTIEEFDRREAEMIERRKLVGISEVARALGITKQRVSVLSKRSDFPAPLARLTSGPVWRIGDISTFAGGWQRKAGRPKGSTKAAAAVAVA